MGLAIFIFYLHFCRGNCSFLRTKVSVFDTGTY